jgi:NADH-dependent peroxiredoxin subunit C
MGGGAIKDEKGLQNSNVTRVDKAPGHWRTYRALCTGGRRPAAISAGIPRPWGKKDQQTRISKKMKEQIAMIQIGQKIDDFIDDFEFEVYQNDETKKVKFSNYEGKWLVLLFYPADFTFICPTELQEAVEYYDEFKKEGAEILSVTTNTVFVHKAWHNNSPSIAKIAYPMVADPTAQLCRYFGTYIEDAGLSLRGTFIIDTDGVLKAPDIHDNTIGRSAEEILRKLQAASFVRQHQGEVCPASWKAGKKTLKPGLDLVGKI